ncbi:MAG: crossover junction endodeoxyribonuclease RuvC [Acidobacteriota bacterium]|nr:crossover junction endodeoxyribonuclease RuvC [Acidobacteriota bacterium]
MIVIGIDPGLASTGYGVIERRAGRFMAHDGGVIETPAGAPTERRLTSIAAQARAILDAYSCEALAFEDLYFGQNIVSAFAVGQARGVLMLLAGERSIPCFSYTPQQVKASVCGHGGAAKDQVARMVAALLALPSPPGPDHASDALAVALCHANSAPMRAAILASEARQTAAPQGAGAA